MSKKFVAAWTVVNELKCHDDDVGSDMCIVWGYYDHNHDGNIFPVLGLYWENGNYYFPILGRSIAPITLEKTVREDILNGQLKRAEETNDVARIKLIQEAIKFLA